jgi:hypothetical protein
MSRRGFFIFFSSILMIVFFVTISIRAQVPERTHVIGVDEQLDIQVWNQVQHLPQWSARVTVRSDGKITMPIPVLDEIDAAGLTVSTLKDRLEGKKLLGKYLNEPRVTITPITVPEKIQISFGGIVSQSEYFPRGVTLGWVFGQLNELIPNLHQLNPNLETVTVKSAEGKEFQANPNLRLEWGDEIIILPQTPSVSPPVMEEGPTVRPSKQAEFTKQEYEDFLEKFSSAKAILEPFAIITDDKVYIALEESLKDQLEEDVFTELEKHVITETPQFINATLVGISINLASKGILEAFLAFPDPNSDKNILVKRFQEGDIVQKSETGDDDIILDEIQDDVNQVILKKGEDSQILSVSQPFTDITLSGILHIGGRDEALFDNLTPKTTKKPIQKRFKAGDEIEPGVVLAEIGESWGLLKKGEEIQLVLLRDPRKRVSPTPLPTVLSAQNAQLPQMDAQPTVPLSTESRQTQPQDLLQALNTFSEIFSATPLLKQRAMSNEQ